MARPVDEESKAVFFHDEVAEEEEEDSDELEALRCTITYCQLSHLI